MVVVRNNNTMPFVVQLMMWVKGVCWGWRGKVRVMRVSCLEAAPEGLNSGVKIQKVGALMQQVSRRVFTEFTDVRLIQL